MISHRAISLAMAASWALLCFEATAQVTLRDADALITDQPSPVGQLLPQPQPQPQSNPYSPSPNSSPAFPPSGVSSPRISAAQPVSNRRSMPTPSMGFQVRLAQAPKMLGDFFGPPATQLCVDSDLLGNLPSLGSINPQFTQGTCFSIPNPSSLVGRLRVQDNNSALPQDRLFFDYSYFHNAQLLPSGVGVHRYVPGFEKTFAEGLGSVEMRIPMATTLNSQVDVLNPGDTQYEFGNLSFITKIVLHEENNWLIAGGLGISVPTGDDLEFSFGTADPLFRVANDSVHLVPYLAAAYASTESSFFANAFLTFDLDTNGSPTFADEGAGLQRIGNWNDQGLMSFDLGIGSWLYKTKRCCDRLQSIAWTTELHYSTNTNDADVVESDFFLLGHPDAHLSLLNMTFGSHVQLGKTTFTAGYVTPLTSSDRIFDGELRLFVNRAF